MIPEAPKGNKQQATCTEALLMEVLGPPALCCDLPKITSVHWNCGAECEGDSRANGKHRVKLFTAPLERGLQELSEK